MLNADICTGCSLIIVFFLDFSELCQFAAALVFYLSGVCTHTDTKGKQMEAGVRNILKSLKKTIFNEHSVHKRTGKAASI